MHLQLEIKPLNPVWELKLAWKFYCSYYSLVIYKINDTKQRERIPSFSSNDSSWVLEKFHRGQGCKTQREVPHITFRSAIYQYISKYRILEE